MVIQVSVYDTAVIQVSVYDTAVIQTSVSDTVVIQVSEYDTALIQASVSDTALIQKHPTDPKGPTKCPFSNYNYFHEIVHLNKVHTTIEIKSIPNQISFLWAYSWT